MELLEFVEYVLGAGGLYLLGLGVLMTTPNVRSALVLRVVPIVLGIVSLVLCIELFLHGIK